MTHIVSRKWDILTERDRCYYVLFCTRQACLQMVIGSYDLLCGISRDALVASSD